MGRGIFNPASSSGRKVSSHVRDETCKQNARSPGGGCIASTQGGAKQRGTMPSGSSQWTVEANEATVSVNMRLPATKANTPL